MRSQSIKQVFQHIILFLAVLLAFILVFEELLVIPEILKYAGRFHPMILHFPVVLLMLAVINSFTREKHHQNLLLGTAVILTLLTAILGILLSMDGYEGGALLTRHKWLGASLAFLGVTWYGLEFILKGHTWIHRIFQASIVVLVVTASHYGAMITHGEGFLSFPSSEEEKMAELPEDPVIFEHIVQPLIEEKCISCHNKNKTKGDLILTGYAGLIKGGESGAVITPGDPAQSELIRRIHLPEEHEEHMPPAEKPQLEPLEIQLLERWISAGASETLRLAELEPEAPLGQTIASLTQSKNEKRWAGLPEVSEDLIRELATDYCTIRRLSEGSNALSVVIFPHDTYMPEMLTSLSPIATNIVRLDLSYLPLGNQETGFLSKCTSLEWLELDHTTINDEGFSRLGELKDLKLLKIHGTSLTGKSLDVIHQMEELETLYLWNTAFAEKDIQVLESAVPGLNVNSGIGEDIEFVSVLPAPEVEPEKVFFIDPLKVRFSHPLQDIDYYYTRDGSDPGEGSEIYQKEILIENSGLLKFMASREGWVSSEVDSIRFFRTLPGPDTIYRFDLPDPEYPGNGEITLFDLEKGSLDLKDSAWLGFQGRNFMLLGKWDEPLILNSITISSFINTYIHVFPPEEIIIRGGESPDQQEIIARVNPMKLTEHRGSAFNYIRVPVKDKPLSYMSIGVRTLERLPEWHGEHGKPAWFFVDEIVLEGM